MESKRIEHHCRCFSYGIEFAPKKINVNCICPGAIKTGMTKVIEENEMILK